MLDALGGGGEAGGEAKSDGWRRARRGCEGQEKADGSSIACIELTLMSDALYGKCRAISDFLMCEGLMMRCRDHCCEVVLSRRPNSRLMGKRKYCAEAEGSCLKLGDNDLLNVSNRSN